MPRANRYLLPGSVWHITHRCHQREFLLKFARDRRRWEHWLFESRKRFGLCVLNYAVTSNHIHLLVGVGNDFSSVSKSIQLIAGRTGQEYNIRKGRRGAFWEDRYHATAVEDGQHLRRCMTYINLNMVRAGVVAHPQEWEHGGYHEIRDPPKRYARIDRNELARLLGLTSPDDLAHWQEASVTAALASEEQPRCPEWTDSIAVGSETFVRAIKDRLGLAGRYRDVKETEHTHILKEPSGSYGSNSGAGIEALSLDNTRLWEVSVEL